MHVKKEMFDKELRPYYWPLKILAKVLTKKWGIRLMNSIVRLSKGKNIKSIDCEEHYIPSKSGGPDIRIRIFRPKHIDQKLPGLLYLHGGGYTVDVPESYLRIMEAYIKTRPCVVVAPDYRKSIEAPYPAGFDDCYDTLLWMKENADTLGINTHIIVGGHSAGGGLTAAVTLKARDTKDVKIAFQMPIYPMIDHRQHTTSAKSMYGVPTWNSENNAVGWSLYLKNVKEDVPAYASPALNEDYKDFPPTITFVGDLEPFKDETLNYVKGLEQANIPTKFALFEGAFHAFEIVAKKTTIGRKANQFQFEAFGVYYDQYAS